LLHSDTAFVRFIVQSHPGAAFDEVKHDAYIPDTNEGRQLLKRLEYAFSRGLTFTIETSTTWAISHKTSVTGGSLHGYPDANYLPNCNYELDSLGVPIFSLYYSGLTLKQRAGTAECRGRLGARCA
jgi:hypothetical protein